MRRRLAVDRGVQPKDHFAHAACLDPAHQRRDAQVARPDAINRREHAAKHMIAAPVRAAALQRPEVRHVLDYANQRIVTPRQLTHGAGLHGVIVAADLAFLDLGARLRHRFGQWFQKLLVAL